jgi:hypothetical protein
MIYIDPPYGIRLELPTAGDTTANDERNRQMTLYDHACDTRALEPHSYLRLEERLTCAESYQQTVSVCSPANSACTSFAP